MSPPSDLVVLGGGVMGRFTAYHAAEQGARVVVLERGRVGDPMTASYGQDAIVPQRLPRHRLRPAGPRGVPAVGRVRGPDGHRGARPLRLHEHRQALRDAGLRRHLRGDELRGAAGGRARVGGARRRRAAPALPVPRRRHRAARRRRRRREPAGRDGHADPRARGARRADGRGRGDDRGRARRRRAARHHRRGGVRHALARGDRGSRHQRAAGAGSRAASSRSRWRRTGRARPSTSPRPRTHASASRPARCR